MQLQVHDSLKHKVANAKVDEIIRKCVHCGFCNATCPTYQILGDERDGPRGRIYLINEVLQSGTSNEVVTRHLDRCLACRSCATTCPSGVEYSKLLDFTRELNETLRPRSIVQRAWRSILTRFLLSRELFSAAIRVADAFAGLLPGKMARFIPRISKAEPWPASRHKRKMLLLEGCVQSSLAPSIDVAAAKVLDRCGISLEVVQLAGCCGAMKQHLGKAEEARSQAKRNIDACWEGLENGAEAVVMSSSACSLMLKEYPLLLAEDSKYLEKAKRLAAMSKDLSEVVLQTVKPPALTSQLGRIAYQAPCSLQHGHKQVGGVEALLEGHGYELVETEDKHLCCGSAGTYSILQRNLSQQLLRKKLDKLEQAQPQLIATANIGCLVQLQSKSSVPVKHWIELLAEVAA